MNSKFLPVYILTIINGLSMMMLFPLLPVIINIYGLSAIVLGSLVATYSFFQMIGAPLLGALSDKYGRKPLLIITQLGTFISWILLGIGFMIPESMSVLGVSLPIVVIFFARILDGITGGNSSVAQAMVADMTTKEERAIVFGKTGAIMGGTLILGPVLGALSMATPYGILGTAIVGAVVSFFALGYMFCYMKESLLNEKKKEVKISFQDINVFSQINKWKKIPIIKMMIVLKIFFFVGFTIYTTVAGLYLIDFFGFEKENIGYYLAFTGSFLIFHQLVSLKFLLKKFEKLHVFLLGQLIMGISFGIMGFLSDIYIFTVFYFFAVLGISVSFNTLQALISTAVDEKSQGEVMGMSNGIESIIMIIAPLFGAWAYGYFNFSIYIIVSFFSFLVLGLYILFFRQIPKKIRHTYSAQKISGDGRGKKMGFPTINCENIEYIGNREREGEYVCEKKSEEKITEELQEGVFAVQLSRGEEKKIYSGVLHVGARPTFDAAERRVEIFVFDFDEDIKDGEKIFFTPYKKIRGVKKFSDQEALEAQIRKDIIGAKNFFPSV